MDICAHCGRKLLSHMSAKCNWCGTEIQDAQYQAAAEVERAVFRAEEALHNLQSLNIVQGNLRIDPLLMPSMNVPVERVIFEAHVQKRLQERRDTQAFTEPAQASAKPPDSDEETKDRFEHLEL